MKAIIFIALLMFVTTIDAGALKNYAWQSDEGHPSFLDDVYCLYWTNCSEPCDGGKRTCPRSNGKEFKIDCHLQDCAEIEDCGAADLVYVLDDSTSIAERNYWITKQFAIDVMKGLTIGPEGTRIGMVTYSTRAWTRWQLGEYETEEELEDAIWSISKIGGNTNTAEGLLHAQRIFEQSSRPSVKHIVVILTDGESNINKTGTLLQAEDMHRNGIEVFAIGIGAINSVELEGIASEIKDEHWHHVPDYTALTHITKVVINETCDAISANKSECDPWSDWGDCEAIENGCGPGQQNRTRECRFYNYEGAEPIRRVDTDYQPCDTGVPCPQSTIEPPEHTCLNWTDCNAACDGYGFRKCFRSNGRVWEIPCSGGPCVEIPCGDADVVLILDSSASIGEKHWFSTKQFAIDVVGGLPLDSADIDVGAVTFSKTAQTEWNLGAFHDEEKLAEMLWELPWLSATTNAQDGLVHAKTVFESSGRPDVTKIAIYISDGESNVHADMTLPRAQELKDLGVKIFTIAVREKGIAELQGICSEPNDQFYHYIDDFDNLIDMVNVIIQETCEVVRSEKKHHEN
jgi:Mg-chelatase subunit ChlD